MRADNECRTSRHGDENCHFSGIYESRLRRDVAYNTHTLSLSRYYEWIHVGIQFVSSQRDKWLVLPEGRVAHEWGSNIQIKASHNSVIVATRLYFWLAVAWGSAKAFAEKHMLLCCLCAQCELRSGHNGPTCQHPSTITFLEKTYRRPSSGLRANCNIDTLCEWP